MSQVYTDYKYTLYCTNLFADDKRVLLDDGFISDKYKNRMNRVEWEHVVPAENFGRTFSEWREGHPMCVSNSGKPYKGRRCANKINSEYRLMQADMYNLFPAIGSVNAMRSNYNFVAYLKDGLSFGSCPMLIGNRKALPPEDARGRIARAYLYMHNTYRRYKMSKQQFKLMNAWHSLYPVTDWECKRYERIKMVQNNENSIMKSVCLTK